MSPIAMLPEELQELMADVAHVKLQDIHLGRVLEKLATHLAHAHGLEPSTAEEVPVSEEEESTSEEDDTVTTPAVKGKGK